MTTYLGNGLGVVLGPYGPTEIRARLFGQEWLAATHPDIYVIRTSSRLDAQSRLDRQLRKNRHNTQGE